MKIIIPSSGFGTRMGMRPDQSKEMLWDVQSKERVIDYSLKICKELGISPIVITRDAKQDLNTYLEQQGISPVKIGDGVEWYDTILKSSKHWDSNNIILLPDTRWNNDFESINNIYWHLEHLKKPLSLGLLEVEDASKWCVLVNNNQSLFEKPKDVVGKALAIGVFGFQKGMGEEMLHRIKDKAPFHLNTNTQYVQLENFKDITREDTGRLICV